MRRAFGAALAALVLGACDAGPSAVPARDHAAAGSPTIETGPAAGPVAVPMAPAATTQVAGKPIWSSNRSLTAEENAKAHFDKDGAEFGARTVAEFVAKTHAFTTKPPKGTQKLTRPNGDVLLYDPAGNVFAVVTRTGAPRTIFKPRDGAAYWEQQKRIEASRKG
jgi:hypothetical protein